LKNTNFKKNPIFNSWLKSIEYFYNRSSRWYFEKYEEKKLNLKVFNPVIHEVLKEENVSLDHMMNFAFKHPIFDGYKDNRVRKGDRVYKFQNKK
jgi:hypothetical protein